MWTAIRAALKIYGLFLLVLLAAGALGWQFIAPPPPERITVAAGPEGGAYHGFANRWAAHLDRDGIRLEVLATAGSVDNLRRLAADPPQADVAIIQGGVSGEAEHPGLRSLGAVAIEAVWLFVRAEHPAERLRDLDGARVAVGAQGSGTRVLALALLAQSGARDVVAVPLGGAEAAEALLSDRIDAAFFVSATPTPTIARLLADPSVRLVDFAPRAEAYVTAFPFMAKARLAPGTVSLADDLPQQAATLLATVVQVVVREDIHPQIVLTLMETFAEVMSPRQFFAPAGAFPAAGPTAWQLHPDAARYYRHGAGILRRYLPFWVAVTIERTWVLIIPLLTLLIPLMRIAPPLLRWQIERKIYRWYRDVRAIERELRDGGGKDAAALLARLDAVSARVAATRVPLSYGRQLYDLRQHIAFVRGLIDGTGTQPSADAGPAG